MDQASTAESVATLPQVVELEAAVAARDRFIAAIGHELRNAIAPLAMLADSIALGPSAMTAERRMQLLSRNLARLTAVLDRVNDVAQLRTEKLVLAPEPLELGAVVREVVAECTAEAQAAGIELRVDAATDVTGRWDRGRLRQIVSHLVANAIRHSGGGAVAITVTGEADHAVLTVADHGRGIDVGRRAHLFDAFDVAAPRQSGGLGVGLWVVQTLCKSFGGSVALVDDGLPGACFRVRVPRVYIAR